MACQTYHSISEIKSLELPLSETDNLPVKPRDTKESRSLAVGVADKRGRPYGVTKSVFILGSQVPALHVLNVSNGQFVEGQGSTTWITVALRIRVLSFMSFGDPVRLGTGELLFEPAFEGLNLGRREVKLRRTISAEDAVMAAYRALRKGRETCFSFDPSNSVGWKPRLTVSWPLTEMSATKKGNPD